MCGGRTPIDGKKWADRRRKPFSLPSSVARQVTTRDIVIWLKSVIKKQEKLVQLQSKLQSKRHPVKLLRKLQYSVRVRAYTCTYQMTLAEKTEYFTT